MNKRRKTLRAAVAATAALGAGGVLALAVGGAFAHSNGCHSAHSCPSDHHTYVWYSGGQGWDCAQAGAPEYEPARDTQTVTYDGRTYYCRAAGSQAPPTTTTTTTDAQPTTTVTDTPPAAAPRCGTERWEVKTLQDSAADQVKVRAKRTTVNRLRAITAPKLRNSTPRIRGVETTTYTVKADLVGFVDEDDSDIHLVIADPSSRRRTMIVEFPTANCVPKAPPAVRSKMRRALQAVIDACGDPTSRFRKLQGSATVTGVGFFDFKHGQRGLAPNGIELHPVLGFASTDCG